MGDFGQSANGFSINLFKEAEDDRLRIRVFAGGKEKQEDDVAGQIMDAGFIDFDTVVDFSMVINIGSASPGIIFNVDGKRSSHVFDDDSILTGSEGGDIRVKYFKEAIKANQVKVGVDKSLITFSIPFRGRIRAIGIKTTAMISSSRNAVSFRKVAISPSAE